MSNAAQRASGNGLVALVLLVRVTPRPPPGTCAYVRSLDLGDGTRAMAPGGLWVAAVSTAHSDVTPHC
jgi:hypothetical protein